VSAPRPSRPTLQQPRRPRTIGLIALALTVLLGVARPALALSDAQQLVVEAWRLVNQSYVDPARFEAVHWRRLRQKTLERPIETSSDAYDAISAMLAPLGDPYTRLLRPDEYATLMANTQGSVSGVGLQLALRSADDQIVVIAPLDGSPAAEAAIPSGTAVLAVNGTSTSELGLEGTADALRGRGGSRVLLLLETPEGKRREVELERRTVDLKPVRSRVLETKGHRLGYLRITQFSEPVPSQVQEVLAGENFQDIDGLILDLRNNSGGAVDEATDLLSEFVRVGDTILLERYRNSHDYTISSGPGRWRRPRPLYVLISEGTVSSGEVFAGGMNVRTNAVMIGSPTYGKGRMQRYITGYRAESFSDSTIAGMMVTNGLYLAGGTLEVDSIGVHPHMEADLAFAPVVALPSSINVACLRRSIPWPTRQVVDSINRIVGADVGHMVWCERTLPLEAYRAVDTMRHRLIVRKPNAPKLAANRPMYPYGDEPAIGAVIRESYGNVLDARSLEKMSVEQQIEQLAKLPGVPRPVQDVLEDDATASVSGDLGLRLATHNGCIIVCGVVPAAISYDAGVCNGDRVISINGKPPSGSIEQVRVQILDAVRKGLNVALRVRRGVRELQLTCSASVRVTSMPMTYIEDSVGFIATDRFCASEHNVVQLWRALLKMRDAGVQTVVFDLRGAQYGQIDHVRKLLSYFTSEHMVVAHARYNNGDVKKLDVNGDGSFHRMSVTIVTDELTTDAAKIFAMAMKLRGNTTLIGLPTLAPFLERRQLDITPMFSFRYPWRSITSATDTVMKPDVQWAVRVADPDVLSAAALQLPRLVHLRQMHSQLTRAEIEQVLKSLPPTVRAANESTFAEAIFGDGARLYVLAKTMRQAMRDK